MNMKQQIRRSVKVLRRSEEAVPYEILRDCKGIVFFTQFKGGFFWSGTIGSGIFLKRLGPDKWSPPVSLGMGGAGVGFQFGFQKADIIIVLNDRSSVRAFEGHGQINFGGDYSITAGPIGRTLKADLAVSSGGFSGNFSYSLSQGLMMGVSLEGACLIARALDNHGFYGTSSADTRKILNEEIPIPENKKEGIEILHKALNLMCKGASRSGMKDLDPFLFSEVENDDSGTLDKEPILASETHETENTKPKDKPVAEELNSQQLAETGKGLLNLGLSNQSTLQTSSEQPKAPNSATDDLDLIDWTIPATASPVSYAPTDNFDHYPANPFDSINGVQGAQYFDTSATSYPQESVPNKIESNSNYDRVVILTNDHFVDEEDPTIYSHGIISAHKGEKGTLLEGDLVNGMGAPYGDYCKVLLNNGRMGKISRHVLALS
mmetsp:Transcript_13508/g.17603  ORF Transcript_13508/g.17603 Transcript_13508/m.17603 type:complete len:434 (-) Transcript_13508:427-1728(-)|eukprot:CAMPEP_0184023206 /NCGR_PEP_ID=MMETSP0954-20121128/11197_1 /TAXON_ID=627963 /ORGANISM="Aplanochytrium sp, Strain PBS07" /LENGTH=433 /DNA_ID=CAMNT_0026305995 /DNA_START=24 /DNA_END=1325 /DNA_ORIENTATION=+